GSAGDRQRRRRGAGGSFGAGVVRRRHRAGRGHRRRRGRLPCPQPAAVRRAMSRPARLACPGGGRPTAGSGAPRDHRASVGGRAPPRLPGVAGRAPERPWWCWPPGYEHPGDPRQPDNTRRH
ncbi:malonyl CoA-acyl carrier protein transacylase fabD2, partial [Mycobacterium tuberculosis SUMu005]